MEPVKNNPERQKRIICFLFRGAAPIIIIALCFQLFYPKTGMQTYTEKAISICNESFLQDINPLDSLNVLILKNINDLESNSSSLDLEKETKNLLNQARRIISLLKEKTHNKWCNQWISTLNSYELKFNELENLLINAIELASNKTVFKLQSDHSKEITTLLKFESIFFESLSSKLELLALLSGSENHIPYINQLGQIQAMVIEERYKLNLHINNLPPNLISNSVTNN